MQFVDTLQGRKIGLHRPDGHAGGPKLGSRLLDLRLVGGDQKVETVHCARFASSSPMPVDAPVTMAKGRSAGKASSRSVGFPL